MKELNIEEWHVVEVIWDKSNTWKNSFHIKRGDNLITLEVFRTDGQYVSQKDMYRFDYRASEYVQDVLNIDGVLTIDHGYVCDEIYEMFDPR